MQSLRPVISTIGKQVRRYHMHDFKAPHMNELPTPSGSWQRVHEQRNRKYNATLIAGITIFTVSLITFKNNVFFNAYAPEHYE